MLHNREKKNTALSLPTISLISRIAQGQMPLHFPTKGDNTLVSHLTCGSSRAQQAVEQPKQLKQQKLSRDERVKHTSID